MAWGLLAYVAGVAALSGILAPRLGTSAALIEILAGVIGANYLGLAGSGSSWLPLLAGLGSIVLIFLAGSAIEPAAFRSGWRSAVLLGSVSFAVPLVVVGVLARFLLGWDPTAALLAGVALSSTAAAVVYVVLAESGLVRTPTGQLLLSACFVTDLGTVLALSFLFERPNLWLLVVLGAVAGATVVVPPIVRWVSYRLRDAATEPDVRVLLFALVLLGALSQLAGTEMILPAYLLGFGVAWTFPGRSESMARLRVVAMALLTPFFFLSAGLSVSLVALAAGAGATIVLYAGQILSKLGPLLPLSRRIIGSDWEYVAVLMSTGLVFGIVAAVFGLGQGILDSGQFSVLVGVIVLSAVIPTVVAQTWLRPEPGALQV